MNRLDTLYSINKFSKLIGVTPQTLRNWEKEGKLIPVKKSANGYRYYECYRCYTDSSDTYLYEYAWGHNFNLKTFCASKHTGRLSCGHSYYCHYYCSNGSCTQKPSRDTWRCWSDYGNGRRAGCSWKTCVG